jgi:AbrB family looped-hinge helix DNA binding protein
MQGGGKGDSKEFYEQGAPMPTSTLTSKGQTTIPKKVRDALHLKTGDRLEFIIESEHRVVLRPVRADLTALDGLLDRSDRPPVTVEEMHDAVETAVRDSFQDSA